MASWWTCSRPRVARFLAFWRIAPCCVAQRCMAWRWGAEAKETVICGGPGTGCGGGGSFGTPGAGEGNTLLPPSPPHFTVTLRPHISTTFPCPHSPPHIPLLPHAPIPHSPPHDICFQSSPPHIPSAPRSPAASTILLFLSLPVGIDPVGGFCWFHAPLWG